MQIISDCTSGNVKLRLYKSYCKILISDNSFIFYRKTKSFSIFSSTFSLTIRFLKKILNNFNPLGSNWLLMQNMQNWTKPLRIVIKDFID